MKNRLGIGFLLAGGLLIATGSLGAHHSEAVFDKERLITIKGTVTKHDFVNPHALVTIKVRDADGRVTPWVLHGTPPLGFRAVGWTQDTVKPGDEVTVTGFPYRDGSPAMSWMRMVKVDGTELPLPAFKKRMLGEFLQNHGVELPPEAYEIYKKSVTTGVGALPDPAKAKANPSQGPSY